jgi:hypothetical protein
MGRDILASAKQIVSRSRGGRERSEGGAAEHQLTQKVDQLQEQLIAIQMSLDALLLKQPLLPGSGKVISAVPSKRFAN